MKELKRVKRIISNGWCRGADARTTKGIPVKWYSPLAKSFDLVGACYKATDGKPDEVLAKLATTLGFVPRARCAHGRWVARRVPTSVEKQLTDLNDAPRVQRRDILALIDKAINS